MERKIRFDIIYIESREAFEQWLEYDHKVLGHASPELTKRTHIAWTGKYIKEAFVDYHVNNRRDLEKFFRKKYITHYKTFKQAFKLLNEKIQKNGTEDIKE